jgi:thioredoxin 1
LHRTGSRRGEPRGRKNMSEEVEITNANFESEVTKSGTPVLVDFWASWCNPCRMIAPSIEAIARDYKGKIKVGKVDVDAQAEVASKFGIVSIPTLILFKDGKEAAKRVGALPKADIEAMLKDFA